MDNGLVVWLDCSCVVQNDHLGFKVKYWRRLRTLVNQNHAFPEVIPLQLVLLHQRLYTEANCLACSCLIHIHAFVVNRPNLHWLELSRLIGPQKQLLIGANGAG